jgi:hypothetical protein
LPVCGSQNICDPGKDHALTIRCWRDAIWFAGSDAGQLGGTAMNLSAPTQVVFLISLVIAIIALIGFFVTIPFVTVYAFWIAIAAYVVLAAGCLMTGT